MLVRNLDKLAAPLKQPSSSRLVAADEDPSKSHHFYLPNDGPLTEAFAMSLDHLSAAARGTWLESLRKQSKKAEIALRRPFFRSRNYAGWLAARDVIEWAAATWALVVIHGQSVSSDEKAVLLVERAKNLALLATQPSGNNAGLRSLLEAVNTALAERDGLK